jgi:salicylate hydroxylase
VKPGTALIAGGGIGGIAAALALSERGWRCHVAERRSEASEAGAGIQIGPNGMRILQRLGVAKALAPMAGIPQAIRMRDGRSGAMLAELPLGDWIERRHGSPYWTAHRADLHTALMSCLLQRGNIEITLGFDVARVDASADGVTVHATDGRVAKADIVIGADGITSSVRKLSFGNFELSPSGRVAARAVVTSEGAAGQAFGRHVGVWLAAGAHVVHYPVRGGSEIALVVVTQELAHAGGWNTSVDTASVLAKVKGLAPELRALLEQASSWRQWPLVTAPALEAWSRGRIVLLGDATQPIMPFLAQGAVMALEDAEALARVLDTEADHATAFVAYETARHRRKHRVQASAARNGRIYHLSGPLAAARNLTLRTVSGTRLMASYDWLYGHKP